MPELEVVRHSHLIDPHMHVWGWEVPLYLFLGGATAGIMIFSALLALRQTRESRSPWSRWAVFLATVLLSIGMLALLLDLEYPMHVWRFYASLQISSPMSWGSWILLLIYPATLAVGLATLTPNEVDRVAAWWPLRGLALNGILRWAVDWSHRHKRWLAWANLWLGVALGVYTGILLGTLGARAAWNSAVLGPLFLVSGFSTGAAVMLLLPIHDDERHFIQKWDMGAIVLEAGLLFLFLLTLLTGGGEPGRQAAGLFLGGSYTALFWSLVVIVGLSVPLLLELIELLRHRRPTWMAPLMLLVGGFALRWILVAAGQA